MATLAVRIGEDLGVEVKLDERMAAHTSMRVGGRVAAYLRPSGATETAAAVRGLRERVAAGIQRRPRGAAGGSGRMITTRKESKHGSKSQERANAS